MSKKNCQQYWEKTPKIREKRQKPAIGPQLFFLKKRRIGKKRIRPRIFLDVFATNTNNSNTLNTNISYTINTNNSKATNTNMATMQEKMAESLAALKAYQDAHGDNLVIHGADVLGRTHTERLVDAGYLTMVLRGWYIPSFPGSEGDSTVWYVSYWSFVSAYLDSKFDGRWCLSPELSLYYYMRISFLKK